MENVNKNETNSNPVASSEDNVLAFWEKEKIFEKSVSRPAKKGSFVFYDGPPFATGTPHYGHLVGGVIKDVIPRFATMKGYQVERKWGWDCHGLPIENIVEKELGTNTKKEIEDLGVSKFNNLCRQRVSTYIDDWREVVRKIGRFVDMDNAYRTMDLPFMESIWWAFKSMWDKGLIYEDNRSMHVCPRCETTLSQSEVSEGYQDVKDLSAIAKFKLNKQQMIKGELLSEDVFVLAWTTTPWTLIGNVALAVGAEIDYVLLKSNYSKKVNENNEAEINSTQFIIAKELVPNFFNEGQYEIISEFKGEDIVSLSYEVLFNYYKNDNSLSGLENAWKIYAADFVTTDEGTGIVHIAPAFGEDDLALGRQHNLPFIQHVSLNGFFKEEVTDFPQMNVKPLGNHSATDIEIIKYLAHHDSLFHKEKYEHSYPHCWRCDTPLINYSTSSLFVNVTKLKPQLLSNAKKINWSPDYLKNGRFGNWLEGARDWSISRQRFWASAIPIWQCSCGNKKVIASVSELEELSGEKISDIHKDKVDLIEFNCDKCEGKMHRVSDVLDCWFESAAMPYAQWHYPFENKEKVENSFPANFIAEGVDQTRTWFYYLHVLAGGLMDSQAFDNVVTNGIVLAEDGKKMSKKLKNYPDPLILMKQYGADALRAYMLASPVVMAENLNFSEKGVQEALRKNIMLTNNIYKFYETFAADLNDNIVSQDSNILDIWIKAKLKELISEVSVSLESDNEKNKTKEINLPRAMRAITQFIDELSTWYIRRSRDRFKSSDESDKQNALHTSKEILMSLAKLMAPFTPFIAEDIWQKVSANNFQSEASVHLEAWPESEDINDIDREVLQKMELARDIVALALAARDEAKIKIRQMLASAKIFIKKSDTNINLDEAYLSLISDELNVAKIEIVITDASDAIFAENERIKLELDTEITPELRREGIKRELVRSINMIRKDLGLGRDKSAKIFLQTTEVEVKETIELMNEDIKKETVSESLELRDSLEGDNLNIKEVKINGILVSIGLLE